MPHRPLHARAAVAAALTLAAALAAAPAHAVNRSWNNPAGGSAGTSTNWSPNGAPTAADNMQFPLAATYSVSIPTATIPQAINHNTTAGVVTVTTDGTHTLTSSYSVGGNSGVYFTRGTILARSHYTGLLAGTYGRFTMQTAGGIPAPPPPVFTTTDATQPCLCGGDGTGRLDVFGGSTMNVAGSLQLAPYTAGRCTLTVSGRNAFYIQSSSMAVNGHALIGSQGFAIANVDNGGHTRVKGQVSVGTGVSGDGTLRVGVSSTTFTPSFYAEQNLMIGDTGFPPMGGGRALVHLAKGAIVVGGRTNLGDPDGNTSQPELRIEGGTFIASNGFSRRNGTLLTHTGGILHLVAGSVEWPSGVTWEIDGALEPAEVWLGNGLTTSLGPSLMYVGEGGPAVLRVTRPGTVLTTDGNIRMGEFVDATATTVVDSGATLATSAELRVGHAGEATLEVRGGSSASADLVRVGTTPVGTGLLFVTGAGSSLTANYLNIGSNFPIGPTGTVRVEDGGVIDLLTADNDVLVQAGSGRIEAGPGGLVTARNLQANGTAALEDGVIRATCITGVSGTIRGDGTIVGQVQNYGLLDPAPVTGALFGRMQCDSSVVLNDGSSLGIALGRPGAPGNDSLTVAGNLLLDGTLALEAHPSFARVPGDVFVVATAAQVSGGFDDVTWNGGPAAGLFDVIVESARVLVVVLDATTDAGRSDPTPGALRFAPLAGHQLGFTLELPEAAVADVRLFDVTGREVARLHDGPLAAGTHRLRVAARGLASGVYFARAEVVRGGRTEVRMAKAVRLR